MTLFFDVNVGTTLPKVLKLFRLPVEYHIEHFPNDAPDDTWLPVVGSYGWTVISHDVKFHAEPNEISAIMQYRIGVFYLWGSQAPRWQKLQCFAKAYDRIVEKEASTIKPYIFRISRSGALTSIPLI